MKLIKYQIVTEVNRGTEEQPDMVQHLCPKRIHCPDDAFERNLAIAQAEAYNGEVTVEEVPDPEREPTTEEQLRADVDFLAIMTGVEL